jgi:predicted transcriptional regulator
MAGKKRTSDQIQSDRAKIASFMLRGYSQKQIADEMKMTEAMVSREVKELRKDWAESAKIDMNEALGQELARIDQIEKEAWEAWEESKKPTKREQQSVTEGQAQKVSIVKNYRTGDPRYMNIITWCVEQRSRLLGLVKNKVTGNIDLTTDGKPLPAPVNNVNLIITQIKAWEESMKGETSDDATDA